MVKQQLCHLNENHEFPLKLKGNYGSLQKHKIWTEKNIILCLSLHQHSLNEKKLLWTLNLFFSSDTE